MTKADLEPLPAKPCKLDFRDGCYVITMRQPIVAFPVFEGTLRVDRAAPDGGPDKIIVSGDLYTRPEVSSPGDASPDAQADAVMPRRAAMRAAMPGASVAAAASAVATRAPAAVIVAKPQIPIFARSRYHSYLRITSVSVPVLTTPLIPCQVTLVAEQFFYTQPPAGQFKGTFPNAPSRTLTLKLRPATAPFPFSLTGGPYFEGQVFEGNVDKGSVTLAWVSPFFRRATLEIDTLTGAVPPAAVPSGGGGNEFFDTIFARTGWQLSVISDQKNVPVPAGVNPTDCWSSGALHNLMTTVRNPATNLDAEWRVHMIVVPAKLGCSRGVMYDLIGVPREGCATFCDDGYPTGDSSNFGAAANKKQRDVPRAYLRSATHEVTHTLNQIHQEQETSADNSIMTTTPSVADVLGGPATGQPGVFPDQIVLAHNATVRHHLNHMPDPVIRPGGWPFATWFPGGSPQASDRNLFSPSEMELAVTCGTARVPLGAPVEINWTLTNRSNAALVAPNDVSLEALFATIIVTDSQGREQRVRPLVIICESAKLAVLQPGESVSSSYRVFWSSNGFAFEQPGRYSVRVSVDWSAGGIPVAAEGQVDVFVDYPASDLDNRGAALVMHPDVGKWVALGGDAYHLTEATRRLSELTTLAGKDAAPRLLRSFDGLMPNRRQAAKARAPARKSAKKSRR